MTGYFGDMIIVFRGANNYQGDSDNLDFKHFLGEECSGPLKMGAPSAYLSYLYLPGAHVSFWPGPMNPLRSPKSQIN